MRSSLSLLACNWQPHRWYKVCSVRGGLQDEEDANRTPGVPTTSDELPGSAQPPSLCGNVAVAHDCPTLKLRPVDSACTLGSTLDPPPGRNNKLSNSHQVPNASLNTLTNLRLGVGSTVGNWGTINTLCPEMPQQERIPQGELRKLFFSL